MTTTSEAENAYREVMAAEPPGRLTPFHAAQQEFVFGEVWRRPELGRRERWLVTLACVTAADAPAPIAEHVRGALAGGELSITELQEFVLHFAVYCGWPKASHVEGIIRAEWTRLREERGEAVEPWPLLPNGTLGENNWDRRIERGAQEFAEVNLVPAPRPDTVYTHAGILNFVFGHVWQRPGLSRRDRRFVTVACVAVSDAPIPLASHVGSALGSGDVTKAEIDEIALHLAVYSGFAKGQALQETADDAWARLPARPAGE